MELGDLVISKSNVYHDRELVLKAGHGYRVFDNTPKEVKIYDEIGQYDYYPMYYFRQNEMVEKRNKLLRLTGSESLIWESYY